MTALSNSEEWIQSSLARLEVYEEVRAECTDILEGDEEPTKALKFLIVLLEGKIEKLYRQLEAVADARDAADDGPGKDDASASISARMNTMRSIPQFAEVRRKFEVIRGSGGDALPTPAPEPAPRTEPTPRRSTVYHTPPPQPAPVTHDIPPPGSSQPAASSHPLVAEAAAPEPEPAAPAVDEPPPGARRTGSHRIPTGSNSVVAAESPAPVSSPSTAATYRGAPVFAAHHPLVAQPAGAAGYAPMTPGTPFPFSAVSEQEFGAGLGYDADDARLVRNRAGRNALLLLLIVGVGIGGYFGYKRFYAPKQVEVAAPTATEAPKVIRATPVPPDTQGPRGAKGAEVEQSAGTVVEERRRGRRGRGRDGSARPQERAPERPDTKVQRDADEPLSGIE
ncbi:MAG: hypothetical protein KC636_37150 [Myxococcales bacterium]|nr:hypothetical protein [Myxococcales bacterium]